MRLTAVLVALALFALTAVEPAAVMARSVQEGQSLGSVDSYDLPVASDIRSASEAYQPKSEGYPEISEEYTSIPEEHAALQEYPTISREYQLGSGEYLGISREYLSISEGYAMQEGHPASGAQGLSLTVPRAQSELGVIASVLDRILSVLVSSVPALLLSLAGMLGAALFSCLSLFSLPCSLPLGMILACAGAVILGALGLIAGPFFGAVAGLVLGPIVLFFLSGVCGFSLGSVCNSLIALCPTGCYACLYGGNTAACCIPWFFLIVWLVLSWTWITFGGFGWGMIIFAIIAAIALIIIGPVSTLCSIFPLVGCAGNMIWLGVSVFILGVVMVLFFIIFDLLYSILLPILVLIGDATSLSPAVLQDAFDIFSGVLYLIFDFVCYMPISLCFYFVALCATIPGTIVGWCAQCFPIAPAISAVAGVFSGLACTILFTVVNLLLGVACGPLLGCLSGCLAGPVAGVAFGCIVGLLAPCLIPLITLASAAMSACVSILALASYLAEVTGTSDVLLSLLVFLRDSISSAVRLILGILVGLALFLTRFLDGCFSLASTYCNLTGAFFDLCYTVLSVCASIGIISPCCVVSCGSVLGILCTFCVQILWNVLYHLTDSFRSCSSCALGILEAMNGRLIM